MCSGQYQFNYEVFMNTPIAEIERLLAALGLLNIDAKVINKAVTNLPTDQYNTIQHSLAQHI